ncbi:MAG: hypothetical protein IJ167_10140 [Lachnospiraceae bacterium]|nr:hypothetical protein [Lachnospiraceae bacterium]
MDLNEFTLQVCDRIRDYLSTFDVDEIYDQDVVKNNGVVYKGIVISLKKIDTAPTIYMDYYYGLYKQGKSMESIVKLIYENYKNSIGKLERTEKEADKLEKYNDNVFIKVVNYEKNKVRLEDCPFIPFMDMAITFRYLVHKDDKEISSAIVKNVLMDSWGLNTHSLYKIAYQNTKRLFPPLLKRLSEIFRIWNTRDIYIPDNGMYVLTNEYGINGAAYITYKDILDNFCRDNNTDYYIIPSSIHELILVPKGLGEDEESLKMYIREANRTVVPKIDFLSDNLYLYSLKDGIKVI